MAPKKDTHYYRVIYSSGDVFYTRARTATQFVLDPVFIHFMILCIFLFTSLMLALGLPAIPQILLFGAGIVSTFVWLTLTIAIYLAIIRLFKITTLLTPVMLLPMQVFNGLTMNYMLNIFQTGYIEGFGFWEITIRTAVIILCLDIIHGKYVAPKHGLTVTLDADGNIVERRIERRAQPSPTDQPAVTAPVAAIPHERSDATSTAVAFSADDSSQQGAATIPAATEPSEDLNIGREKFNLSKIYAISSEDHYLVVHFANSSEMVRGRLGQVVSKIDVCWGIQINRSAWLAYAALDEVRETPKGQVDVTLKSGMTLRVANSRKLLFEHGCAQYVPTLVWSREPDSGSPA